MPFVIKKEDTFSWPVTVKVPKAGSFEANTFSGTFRVLDTDTIDKAAAGKDSDNVMFDAILCGWEGVIDEAGAEVAYSKATHAQLRKNPLVRMAVIGAYTEAMTGRAAQSGN